MDGRDGSAAPDTEPLRGVSASRNTPSATPVKRWIPLGGVAIRCSLTARIQTTQMNENQPEIQRIARGARKGTSSPVSSDTSHGHGRGKARRDSGTAIDHDQPVRGEFLDFDVNSLLVEEPFVFGYHHQGHCRRHLDADCHFRLRWCAVGRSSAAATAPNDDGESQHDHGTRDE